MLHFPQSFTEMSLSILLCWTWEGGEGRNGFRAATLSLSAE